jgi:hypothetical protein
VFETSALCCETCLNSFKQISGNLLQFTWLIVANYFTNIVSEPPSPVDCWHTKHFLAFRTTTLPPSISRLSKGPSTLLVLVLVGRLVWLSLVLVNRRPHYFSCSPGFGAWGSIYLLVVCIGCSKGSSSSTWLGRLVANPFDVLTTSGASRASGSCGAYCLSRDLSYRPHYSRA